MQTLEVPHGAPVVGQQIKVDKEVFAKGREVTVSRARFGKEVSANDADMVAFGHLTAFSNFPGLSVGDTIKLPRGRVTNTSTSPITEFKIVYNGAYIQVVHAKTESGSIYELHVVK